MAEALSVPIARGLPAGSGRYTVYGEIASGGMATVQYGQLIGPGGFARGVAIKRLHAQFARDPGFMAMFLDEARLAARIAHANVIPTIDVLSGPGEISVVMEYVHGETLASLLSMASAHSAAVPCRIAVTLLSGVLHGLHAAHETRGERGEPLHIVHRDVSPQNILVGSDGVARLLDFGIAKTQLRTRATPTGELKGKLAYMSCEQYQGEEVDRRTDVYGASVVLWEALTGRGLFEGPNDAAIASAVMTREVPPPSAFVPEVPAALDRIVLRGLSRVRDARYPTAREMALALEREIGIVPQSDVSDWVNSLAGELLAARAAALSQMRQRAEGSGQRAAPEVSTRRVELADPSSGLRTVTRQGDDALPGSGAALSTDPSIERRRRALRLVWIGGSLIALAAAVAGLWLSSRPHGNAAPARAAQTAPSPAADRAVPLAEAVAPPVLPAAVATPAAALPAGDDARAERDVRSAGVERARSRPGAGARRSQAKARKDLDCTQPFVVDAQGIRRVKRECL